MTTLQVVARRQAFTLCMLAACTSGAWAQAAPLQKGDVIHLDVNLELDSRAAVDSKPAEKKQCFNKGSSFDIVTVDEEGTTFLTRRNRWRLTDEQKAAFNTSCDGSVKLGEPQADATIYSIAKGGLKPDYYRHRGITHGALFVPFKRRHDKSLSGESNLGYYLGYRFGGPWGVAITPAASVGMSIVNVTDDTAVSGTTTLKDSGTRPAFTWTVGFIVTHLDAFQVGLFAGRDRIGGDVGSSWKFENRTWVSVAFGYSFSR